jgi:adenosine/AMP kinase
MELLSARIEKPEAINFILGQTHFIKTVEDLHEALVGAVPGIRFGLAFCEASGKCLVRWSGTDPAMIELAKSNALAIGAGRRSLFIQVVRQRHKRTHYVCVTLIPRRMITPKHTSSAALPI